MGKLEVWQGSVRRLARRGRAVSGLERPRLVGALLLGSGEEEEPSCRGGGAAGKVPPAPPRGCFLFVLSLRYLMLSLLLREKSGGDGRRV